MSSESSIKRFLQVLRSKKPEVANHIESLALATTQHLSSGNEKERRRAEENLQSEIRQLAGEMAEARFMRGNISMYAVIIASEILLKR